MQFELVRANSENNIEYIVPGTFREGLQQLNKIELAKKERNDVIASTLEKHTLKEAVESYLAILKPMTARSYKTSWNYMTKFKILNPDMLLSDFALINYPYILGEIRTKYTGARSSRQVRAGFLISLTRYLSTRTNGIIPICSPIKQGVEKTFTRVREKASTKPLTRPECSQFLEILSILHVPTYIIAKVALNSGRRITEVLNLRWKDIDFDLKFISFSILKTEMEKIVRVRYKQEIFDDLLKLKRVSSRTTLDDYVFQRINGSRISYPAIWARFKKCGDKMEKKLTPHVLRATYISLASAEGHRHSDIASVTGHSSLALINYYDGLTKPGTLSETFTVV